ncbi:MAG: hypothetical protein M1423_04815 [Acidobacteria bacterium]|nr:hypothetical protein [Acidobacteriota bacterium]
MNQKVGYLEYLLCDYLPNDRFTLRRAVRGFLTLGALWEFSILGYFYFALKGEAPPALQHSSFWAVGTTTPAAACMTIFQILTILTPLALAAMLLDSIITWRKKWGRAQILPTRTWRKPR